MADDKSTTSVEYRSIAGIDGFRFGDDGTVWSLWRFEKISGGGTPSGWRHLIGDTWECRKASRMKSGHLRMAIKGRGRLVHRLILEAFRGPCPPGMECRHLDGNPENNCLGNLAWGTRAENVQDSVRHGTAALLKKKGENHSQAKLTEDQVRAIKQLLLTRISLTAIGVKYGVSRTTIGDILRGKIWQDT